MNNRAVLASTLLSSYLEPYPSRNLTRTPMTNTLTCRREITPTIPPTSNCRFALPWKDVKMLGTTTGSSPSVRLPRTPKEINYQEIGTYQLSKPSIYFLLQSWMTVIDRNRFGFPNWARYYVYRCRFRGQPLINIGRYFDEIFTGQ